jgi:alkylated DNA nucleotide flippase Atl1
MVAAKETTLQEILGGTKQYQVPLYQRAYSWGNDQLAKLWDDLVLLADDRAQSPGTTHFIGSLVLAPSSANGPAGVLDFLVVDGQQRLTTLSLLLCALRDRRGHGDAIQWARVNETYLINRFHPARYLKVLPTQADRTSYLACVDSAAQAGGADRIGAAYRFFAARLGEVDTADQIDKIEDAILAGLAIVAVTAQQGDNAYRIFESLNNTGLKLTQADLLRNYLFMRLPNRGEAVYQSLWLPLQQSLTPDDLEMLFWLDLVQEDPRAKQTEVYSAQQVKLERLRTEAEVETEVARFNRLGELLRLILDPGTEEDPDVRRRLARLRVWGTTTVYPVLLRLLELREQGKAASAEIARAMLYLESFFVRRLMTGQATNNLNRILLSAVTEMDTSRPADEAIRTYLSTGRKSYATDEEVKDAASRIPFYLNGRAPQRKLILQWLEESYGSKEPVAPDKLTIEHVLPQTPTAEWRVMLGEDLTPEETFEGIHNALLHTLGNLTLTGYNSALSNISFANKRELLARSGIVMNQEIAAQPRWGRSEICARAAALAERIAEVWPGPTAAAPESPDPKWDVLSRALAEIPAGAWTTYGDLGALIGAHPIAVGTRLATYPAPNAHRVLQVGGTVSEGFRWTDPERTDDPRILLEAEGVVFDDHDRAGQQQRLSVIDLAQLAGVTVGELAETLPAPSADDDLADRFSFLLSGRQDESTAASVLAALDSWGAMGGSLNFGLGSETSCFLLARGWDDPRGSIWPVALYPSGKCEVVFQHLARRPPFDDVELRMELRDRLNKIPGVDLPASKIELRPGFPLAALAAPGALAVFVDALTWFYERATGHAVLIDTTKSE